MKRVIDGNFIFQQHSALMLIAFNTQRWDNKSLFDSILCQQHLCQKLPKSVDVWWSYSVWH